MHERVWGVYVPAVIFLATVMVVYFYGDLVSTLAEQITGMNAVSYFTYVAILVVAVVAMPVTVMPLIPIAATLIGPLTTAVLSVIGWTVGGAIAFLIARHVGRPILERYVSFEKLDELTQCIPTEARFLSIVLLRLTLPVDLVSYALGFSRTIGFFEYVAATFVGVIWFSFAFAYMGDALLDHNVVLLIEIGAASMLLLTVCWLLLSAKRKRYDQD